MEVSNYKNTYKLYTANNLHMQHCTRLYNNINYTVYTVYIYLYTCTVYTVYMVCVQCVYVLVYVKKCIFFKKPVLFSPERFNGKNTLI